VKRLPDKRSISCFKKGPYETLARRISLYMIADLIGQAKEA
jgi:hypothetical protein